MKLTKNCLFPWQFIIIHAGGLMCPCCAMNDADYGDFLLDYINKIKNGQKPDDVFNNAEIQALKKGLLTGNLRPMCQTCSLVTNELITTDELREKLIQYLKKQGKTISKYQDLTQVYAYERAGIGLTNKCNLRCIYCNQSGLAESNPYFKMDFPAEWFEYSLEILVKSGVTAIETGAFGEATIHPKWYEIFSKFHEKHPEVKLCLTTNLCRKYTDSEILLLAQHTHLRISLDTLDENLFEQLRKNGNLKLILENISRIESMMQKNHIKGGNIAIDSVICNLTWESIPEVSSFAFEHGFSYSANNYEPRPNSTGYQLGLLQPIESMPKKAQAQVREELLKVAEKARKGGFEFSTNGDLFSRTENNYNRFKPYDNNPVYHHFYQLYPLGLKDMYLDIVYDHFHNSYEGIYIAQGESLKLDGLENVKSLIMREIMIYKKGKCSEKYNQKVLPGYKKELVILEGKLEYRASASDSDVAGVLLQIIESC